MTSIHRISMLPIKQIMMIPKEARSYEDGVIW